MDNPKEFILAGHATFTVSNEVSGMNIGQQITISMTYGNSTNPDDVAARGQSAIIVEDLYEVYKTSLSKNLYEVVLLSGPAVGEKRMVTAGEMQQ